MKMITIINHSDSRGGASVVSRRLFEALRSEGAYVHMLVAHKTSHDSHIVLAGNALTRKISFLAEHARIFASNGFDRRDLFKTSLGSDGTALSRHQIVKASDVIILNWVNQGMLSLDEIGRMAASGKRIIWTMHDMWNATALCHHAGTCDGYRRAGGCSHCPLLHNLASAHDLSTKVWANKRRLYESADITFVAVSRWLAERCAESPLMRGCRVEHIPNAFPIDQFYTEPRWTEIPGVPLYGQIIVMGAARLDDPIKGLPLAVEALNRIADCGATAVFYGSLRDRHALDGLRMPHVWLGTISSHEILAELYARASVVLSSSEYETLPGTLIEGQASGAFPVAFDRGGQRDIIDHGRTGWIAPFGDTASLAEGIMHGLEFYDTEALRASAERFAAPEIARRYLELMQ